MAEAVEQDFSSNQNLEPPDQLPLLPVRDIVVFPYMVLPLFVGREMSIKAIEAALAGNRMLFLATQKSLDILVQGLAKGRIEEYIQNDPYYSVRIEKLVETKQAGSTLETEAVMRTVKEQIEKIVSLGKVLIPDVMVVIENLEDPGRLARFWCCSQGNASFGGRHRGGVELKGQPARRQIRPVVPTDGVGDR